MKIVLINPRSKSPGEIQQKCFPPLQLLYIASALLKEGHEVELIDAFALGWDNERVAKEAGQRTPQVIGVTLLSELLAPTHELIARLRQSSPSAKIVIGGAHANASARQVLEEFSQADFVLQGEAEESFPKLCRALLDGKTAFSGIGGLYWRENGRIMQGQMPQPIQNLDALIPPARHLLDSLYTQKKYYMILLRQRPVDSIITSRGCPFRCAFCSNIPGAYRARSPENVMEEIAQIYARGIRNLDIADANFAFDRSRALGIFHLIKKEGLKISFRFKTRSDCIDEELVKEAAAAGAYLISLGMESGSQHILQRMSKGTTVERNIAACQAVMKHGVKLNTGWIIGFPGETPQTIEDTVSLILRIRPTTANINALLPYPGTQVYEQAKNSGTLAGDWSASSPCYPWVKLPWINTYEELATLVQRVRRRIYYRTYYISNFAREVICNMNVALAGYALQEAIKSLRITPCPRQESQSF